MIPRVPFIDGEIQAKNITILIMKNQGNSSIVNSRNKVYRLK